MPPSKPKRGKGKEEPPQPRKNVKNPKGTDLVPLNFRVAKRFRRDFKITAASHDISQVNLLMQAFYEWKKNNPFPTE